jgi:hypothetical protein
MIEGVQGVQGVQDSHGVGMSALVVRDAYAGGKLLLGGAARVRAY